MNKAAIKAFATDARKKLIASVSQQMTEHLEGNGKRIAELEADVAEKGFDAVAEEAAYLWFKRIIGVRFMEVNGYLPGGVRVLSSCNPGQAVPDIVAAAPQREKTDALFTSLFIDCCRSLAKILPDYFGSECGYPDVLLELSFRDENGIVRSLVDGISEDDLREAVEIVGWLYQYYNDDRKNEVTGLNGGRVKREDVPAATQFFTTDWIARSMVDNSLGKYWLERRPESPLKAKLLYYLGDGTEVPEQSVAPQEIKILDPCMGSGHILVYAFEVLIEIYKECGYSASAAAEQILRCNLYGLDIDQRSYELTCFALFMKARSYNADILAREIPLNLFSIQESNAIGENLLSFVADGDEEIKADLQNLTASFQNAKEYGSLISIGSLHFDRINRRVEEIRRQECGDLFRLAFREDTLKKLLPLIRQAQVMAGTYAVVATNPPYLYKMNKKLKNYVNHHYHEYASDLFAVFLYRNFGFCKENGYCAFMSPFVWMFIKTYQKLREYILQKKSISSLIQLEYSAFEEATVPICTFVLKNGPETKPGVYLRLSDFRGGMEVQKQKVIEAVKNPHCPYRYETPADRFTKIPGMPIAYWANREYGDIFADTPNIGAYAAVTNGLFTCDNQRFLRYWYEVPPEEIHFHCSGREECEKSPLKWYPYNKGGEFRKWYGNHEYVVNFQKFGEEISRYRVQSGQSGVFPGRAHYFMPSISWSFVSSSKFGARYYPGGFVFDVAGSSVFMNREEDVFYTLGFLSSKCAFEMLNLMNPTLNYQAGNIAKLPLSIDESVKPRVDELVRENIAISKADWDLSETSWNFETHPLLKFKPEGGNLSDAYAAWKEYAGCRFQRLKENEEEINRIFISLYGLQDSLTPEVQERDLTVRRADFARDIQSFLHFAVGCVFGRYKVPGYHPNITDVLPVSGELPNDLVTQVVSLIRCLFGEAPLEGNLEFIASALGGSGSPLEKIRAYYTYSFYREHCKMYKKRPIYWLFNGGACKALCYIHAYRENTLSHMLEYFMETRLRLEEKAKCAECSRGKAAVRLKQLKRLEQYAGKLEKAASRRIRLNLDDGVLVNYSKVQNGQNLLSPLK
ncbi:BREX-1 system adenine-specific DNA-methyltransferase PglX [Caproiciproducens galactitolivorans]|uniref:site-specific DNA-methyltransferase (adenine-specific) n=1 Tax=Caproiciproducens galactitolivorans TaxID=642589 RepID=A0ABT4BRU1_9FIRM|nr:BREX-1 system adenine-specific DNA-methyltransferase PglX [Caproiciproducens galactitolivorans]MCY1712823.1 BREX-1 system adenine-specific DNA-methyltransferase PglX [Caproiciproducens galactitolivorans]